MTGASAAVAAAMAPARITQRQLAEAIGMSPTSVGDRLRGIVAWRVVELTAVASVLGVDVAELLRAEPERTARIPTPRSADEPARESDHV